MQLFHFQINFLYLVNFFSNYINNKFFFLIARYITINLFFNYFSKIATVLLNFCSKFNCSTKNFFYLLCFRQLACLLFIRLPRLLLNRKLKILICYRFFAKILNFAIFHLLYFISFIRSFLKSPKFQNILVNTSYT